MFVVILLTLALMGIGLVCVHDKKTGRDARTVMYLFICAALVIIILFLCPDVWTGKPITHLLDGATYIVHFQYSDWDLNKAPVFLQLATKDNGRFLHYQIPRYKLLNEKGELFSATNQIYPVFKVSYIQRARIIEERDLNQKTEVFGVYKLTPTTIPISKK